MKKSERIKLLEDEIAQLKSQVKSQKEQIDWLMQNHQSQVIISYPEVVPSYPIYNPAWVDDQSTAQPYPYKHNWISC